MDLEARGELIEQAEAYRLVGETINTPGWKKYLIPRFERIKETQKQVLLNSKDLNEIIRAQEKMKAITELIEDITICLAEGKEAIDTLAKEKE